MACKSYSLAIFLFFSLAIRAGTDSLSLGVKKYTISISWGYHKGWHSPSNIRFYNPGNNNYDFTIEKVRANDRPSLKHIFRADISIPQYVYRLGIYNHQKKIGIEINFDHAKYIVINDQRAHVKGQIFNEPVDKDTVLIHNFVRFEHTNGANYLMINVMKRIPISVIRKKPKLMLSIKPGAGICVPKTETWLFGEGRDAPFHIAGYIIGVESGPRLEFCRYFYTEATFKGAFVNFTDVLTVNNGRAKHHYFTAEAILTAGFLFHF